MIYYFPLESYKARYTCQLSAPYTGWLESRWIEYDIPYHRVDGVQESQEISSGSVLDACQRGIYSCYQIAEFLKLLNAGKVTSDDVIYLDDFWTPGLEALPYAFYLTGIKPRIYGLLHAQSVDQNDFTYGMLPWIRFIEQGYGSFMDGIFVSCCALYDAVIKGGIGNSNNVFKTGLPFNSDRVRDYFPFNWTDTIANKKEQVVFSSRWDTEKDPRFFLKVAQWFADYHPHVTFVITTSHTELQSNDKDLLDALKGYDRLNLDVRVNQTKEQYYQTLLESKFQFNCAHQDYISWTLLEALTCKCIPIYPDYLSFPEFLPDRNMYDKGDVGSAIDLILSFEDEVFDEELNWIVDNQDHSWERMARKMGV